MGKKISRREIERRAAQRKHSDPIDRVKALKAQGVDQVNA